MVALSSWIEKEESAVADPFSRLGETATPGEKRIRRFFSGNGDRVGEVASQVVDRVGETEAVGYDSRLGYVLDQKEETEEERLKRLCAERERLAAEGKHNAQWDGPVNYEFISFIGSYGSFEGVLTSNEVVPRTATISGNLFGVGVQAGYVTGQIEQATWIGNSGAEIEGANGVFFNGGVSVGIGPLNGFGLNGEIAAHNGPNNADVSSIQGNPEWPGLSTTFDPANPKSYLEKPKLGVGGGGGVNGFNVQNFTITSDPCAGLK